MGVLLNVFTVIFVLLCIILVIVILLQSDKSAGMGILGGGSSSSAFGSSTADVITKITAVMITIFMLGSLGLAIMESSSKSSLKDKQKIKSPSKTTGLTQQAKKDKKKLPVENDKQTK
jgi:preprotein translocase subunit SecG